MPRSEMFLPGMSYAKLNALETTISDYQVETPGLKGGRKDHWHQRSLVAPE
jgi:hypothetical protein